MSHRTVRRVVLVASLVAIIGVGIAVYVATAGRNKGDSLEAVMSNIGRHVVLPSDEMPALLTVTDPAKVNTQFLKQAQSGDKVLVYQKYKRAIIYRPSLDKIVDIGPVIIENPKVTNQ